MEYQNIKIILALAVLFLYTCSDNFNYPGPERIILNRDLQNLISTLDEKMYYLRGDILKPYLNRDTNTCKQLHILEKHRHTVTELLNNLQYVDNTKWKDFKSKVIKEIKTVKNFIKKNNF